MKKDQPNQRSRLFVCIIGKKDVFQIFLQNGNLLLYRVGNMKDGIDESLVQTVHDAFRPTANGDIMLRERDAVRIRQSQKDGEKIIRIRMLHRFLELKPFHCDRRMVCSTIVAFAPHAHGAKCGEKHIIRANPLLRIANILLAVFSLMMFLAPANHLLDIFALPALLLLYCYFPGELTLIDTLKRTGRQYEYNPPVDISRQVCHGRINITIALLFCAAAVRPGANLHNIQETGRLYLFAAVLAAILLAIVLFFTYDWRDQKSCIAVLVVALMFYCTGTIAILNRSLDDKPYTAESAVVVDKYSSGSTKTRSHKIIVNASSGEERYALPLSIYQSIQNGDMVVIYHHEGWLGIPYSEITLP